MDYQKKRVYLAEYDFEEVASYKKYKTIKRCQRYVDELTEKAWFKNRWGHKKISVVSSSSNQKNALAYECGIKISLPEWARNEITILHELSHCATGFKDGHNNEFCKTFLQLVEYKLGKKKRNILKLFFKSRKVEYK
jgi:putative metallohydrolase (TIGR04338 family)